MMAWLDIFDVDKGKSMKSDGGSRNQEEGERRERGNNRPQGTPTGATSRIRHDTTVGGVLPSSNPEYGRI
ncbi:hypothetical protein Anas_05283 [Armadillidium nasatum]|uniref:Uncharacterized protein n=1 Tax=Armadillidium nasatum TaxID=96803 RepID=A0A5N5TNY0_9CRUS|nr:hypothetical protein Anas_05283 [Armadillidium nasatum]